MGKRPCRESRDVAAFRSPRAGSGLYPLHGSRWLLCGLPAYPPPPSLPPRHASPGRRRFHSPSPANLRFSFKAVSTSCQIQWGHALSSQWLSCWVENVSVAADVASPSIFSHFLVRSDVTCSHCPNEWFYYTPRLEFKFAVVQTYQACSWA